MCVRCEKQRKVFAHGYLVPKGSCGCGCRTARLVAVSEDGREFSYTVDENRYALSGSELWDAFEAYLKECGVAPGDEIWFSQSYDETFRGTLASCEPCKYSNCFVLSDNMEYLLPNGMKELGYEYSLRAAFLERKQTFDEFRKECGYDPANEPYAGRELYHAYKQQVDKDEFSPEECGKIAAYLRAGIGKIGAVGELVWVEALRVLLRDAPMLFAEVLDEFCTMYEGLNEDEREMWTDLIELVHSELCASDKKEAQSAWEKHIWRLAYPSMQKEAAEAIARGIDVEERAEQALWFDFPTPFQCGDVLVRKNSPFLGEVEREQPFVLTFLRTWGREDALRMGESEERAEGFEMVLNRLREVGDMYVRSASGFLLKGGSLQRDDIERYLDFEYCREELKGEERILKALSLHGKGEIATDLLLKTYHIVFLEAEMRSEKKSLYDFPRTTLKEVGIDLGEEEG